MTHRAHLSLLFGASSLLTGAGFLVEAVPFFVAYLPFAAVLVALPAATERGSTQARSWRVISSGRPSSADGG